tara:strand:- start:1017 stop:1571 length:555 start_codon:yes stop_codon:yes gene_type:complete
MKIGYARTSTIGQNLDSQVEALEQVGCTIVRKEQVSGTKLNNRRELLTILDFIREGETLVVTRIDRLARSLADLQVIVNRLKEKGANLMATEQPVDTSTAAGKAFFDMLGVFAEFETSLRRERQAEGIAVAKKAGKYRGRKASVDKGEVLRRLEAGDGPTRIARDMRISRATVYSIKNEPDEQE